MVYKRDRIWVLLYNNNIYQLHDKMKNSRKTKREIEKVFGGTRSYSAVQSFNTS